MFCSIALVTIIKAAGGKVPAVQRSAAVPPCLFQQGPRAVCLQNVGPLQSQSTRAQQSGAVCAAGPCPPWEPINAAVCNN